AAEVGRGGRGRAGRVAGGDEVDDARVILDDGPAEGRVGRHVAAAGGGQPGADVRAPDLLERTAHDRQRLQPAAPYERLVPRPGRVRSLRAVGPVQCLHQQVVRRVQRG